MDDVKTCVGDVKYVHLKDKVGLEKGVWNFPPAGSGTLPLKEFMEYMDEHGYTGIYSCEIELDEAFTMRDKVPGDLEVANKAAKDAYAYLKSIGRV